MASRGNTWTVPAGQSKSFTVTIRDGQGAAILSTYTGAEALPSSVWEGGALAPDLGVLAATWHTAAAGTVDVVVSPPAAMTPGFYRVRLEVFYAGALNPYFEGWLKVDAVPGTAAEAPVYCTLQDCLDRAGNWLVQLMQGGAADQTNFDIERALAREWLDDCIIVCARPYAYNFDLNYALIYGSFPFGPIETPDTVITGYLASNFLMVKPRTIECTVYKTLEIICQKRVTFDAEGDEYRKRAAWYHAMASSSLRRYRAEIDFNGDGKADVAFNLAVIGFR